MKPARLDLADPQDLVEIEVSQLVSSAVVEGGHLRSAVLEGVQVRDLTVLESRWDDVTFTEADLTGLRVSESVFSRLSAPHLQCARSTWRDVSVDGSRVGAADLYEAGLHGVRLSGCKLDLVNLRGSRLTDVVFEHGQIGELDLSGVSAKRVQFIDCRLESLVLHHAELTDVDLTGAELSSITGVEYLRGAGISAVQLQELAPYLAAQAGITVLD